MSQKLACQQTRKRYYETLGSRVLKSPWFLSLPVFCFILAATPLETFNGEGVNHIASAVREVSLY